MSPKNIVIFFALIFTVVSALPTTNNKKTNFIEQEKSCRDVCGLCDCDGFYCEDECICECNLETEDNIQCIAEMKDECDAHGLEYEILMQDAAKERFLRQVKNDGFDINDLGKHLVILKQKRASNSSDPVVASAAPKDETVAAGNPDETVAKPLSAIASITGLKAFSGLGGGLRGLGQGLPANWNKILVDARNSNWGLPSSISTFAPLPTINLRNAVTLPAAPTLAPLPRVNWQAPSIAPLPPLRPAALPAVNWRLGSAQSDKVAAPGPIVSPNSS